MGLPATLKNFLLTVDGQPWSGAVPEVSLPKLSMKGEDYQGGGMMAPVSLHMGLEKLTMQWKVGGMRRGLFSGFGASRVDAVQLRFTGAYQADDIGGYQTGELVVRGRHSEIDPGTAKTASPTEISLTTDLVYLKWTLNGRQEFLFDLFGNVLESDGVDHYAEMRLALGLL